MGIGSYGKNPFISGTWRMPLDGFDKPVGRMQETIEVLKKLWTEDNVTYNGKFYKLENYASRLNPITKPHPPIWVNGGGPRMLKITGMLGNGWISGVPKVGVCTPNIFRERLTQIRQIAKRAGRDPEEIEPAVLAVTTIAVDHTAALKLFEGEERRYLVRRALYRELDYKEPWTHPEDVPSDAIETSLRRRRIFGTPDECIEQIETFIKAGARHFILLINSADESGFFEALDLYGEQVIPYFREKR